MMNKGITENHRTGLQPNDVINKTPTSGASIPPTWFPHNANVIALFLLDLGIYSVRSEITEGNAPPKPIPAKNLHHENNVALSTNPDIVVARLKMIIEMMENLQKMS